jgi:hypothetical protein
MNKRAGDKKLGQDSWYRTAGIGKSYRTARTEQLEKTVMGVRQAGQDSWNVTAGTGHP